jgi:thiol:disulfide interchange protein DsbD
MGLLIGVVAAPCVGPVVIALLGAAPLLDALTLFALFVTLSLGLGLPYLLLAVFVGAAQKLRSGKWNVWVNRFFGVVLLGAAIYFGVQTAYAFGWLKGEHPWQPYTPQALERAIAEGKPVVIDFWATWCLACKELEHKTFSDPRVQARLRDFVTLQVDMTTGKDPVANAAAQRFGVRGLPTVVFIGPDGKEHKDLRLEGFEPPEQFLKRLEAVVQRRSGTL